jgi:hypothetical protein
MWFYKNKKVTSIEDTPEGSFGFVYEIKLEVDGKTMFYVGRKNLYSERNIKLSKRALDARTDKRASKKKKVIKESDWKKYYGSNKKIKELILKHGLTNLNIKRRILEYAYSDVHLKFLEAKQILCNDLLLKENYLNDNISIKHIGKPNFRVTEN